jgi:hypothetical protein
MDKPVRYNRTNIPLVDKTNNKAAFIEAAIQLTHIRQVASTEE